MENTPLTGRRHSDYDEDGGKKKRNIIIVGVILFLIIAVAITVTLVIVLKKKAEEESLRQRLNKIGDNLNSVSDNIASFWDEKGLDGNFGFFGTLDRQGNSIQPDTKSLLQISQHLWAYSTLVGLRNSTQHSNYLTNLYNFLLNYFYNRGIDYGQFFYLVSRNGSITIDDSFKVYAEAYTLLGVTRYFEVTGDQYSLEYFDELFDDIDFNAHDPVYGGYNETFDPSGNRYATTTKDALTHLALLEALTSLGINDQSNPLVKPRLIELINIFTNTFIRPEKYIHQTFGYSWNPTGSTNENYGLDLEAVFALRKAGEVVGMDNLTDLVKSLGEKASSKGFDSNEGGYYFEGNSEGDVINTDKVYTTQASSLVGNWELYLITKDSVYLDRIEKTIDWINNSQADKEFKEWYHTVSSNGSYPFTQNKGTHLKASFHTVRASLWLADQIKTYAA